MMIELPDPQSAWEFENGFYLTCGPARLGKLLAHYELFRRTLEVPGAVVECGVFKGASLSRFAMLRSLFAHGAAKPIVAFDTFGAFPVTDHAPDRPYRQRFVETAGEQSIGVQQMREVLRRKGCDEEVELVAGDIRQTVPAYVESHPHLRISLLNLDTDVYEPATVILEHLFPRIASGGVLILDDYGTFPGETRAVDEYFAGQSVEIRRFPFSATPCYVVRD